MKNYLLLFLLIFSGISYGQEYRSAFGLKSGYPGFIGLNLKKNFGRNHKVALDNVLGINFDSDNRYLNGQILLEFNKPVGFNTGFNIYGGLGPTIQYYTNGGFTTNDGKTYNGLFVRGDVVLGLEKLNEQGFPINVAFEVGPAIIVVPVFNFGVQFTIALRYAFREN